MFTDWIFPSTTRRLFYWACQKASPGWGRVPPTHHLQEAEAERPGPEGANLRIKGYCDLNFLTGFICSIIVLFQHGLFSFKSVISSHSVARKYAPSYKSFHFSIIGFLRILNWKGKRHLLHPCHVNWWYSYVIHSGELVKKKKNFSEPFRWRSFKENDFQYQQCYNTLVWNIIRQLVISAYERQI